MGFDLNNFLLVSQSYSSLRLRVCFVQVELCVRGAFFLFLSELALSYRIYCGIRISTCTISKLHPRPRNTCGVTKKQHVILSVSEVSREIVRGLSRSFTIVQHDTHTCHTELQAKNLMKLAEGGDVLDTSASPQDDTISLRMASLPVDKMHHSLKGNDIFLH
jgi:hypothetical protein